MTRITTARAAGALGLAVLLASAGASGAADGTSTATLGALTSTASTSVVKVVGTADLQALPAVEVGKDAAGDSRAPGTDLVGASITQLGGGVSAFDLKIANMAPTVGSLPAVLHHNWDFEVVNGSTVTALALKAINRGAVIASALEGGSVDAASFALQTCTADEQTGQNTCTSEYIDGSYSDTGVRFLVDNARIGLVGGSSVVPGENGINVSVGASDVIWFTNGSGGDTMAASKYVAPQAVVELGIAPAGTPVEDVVLSTVAPVKGKAFTANLPKGTPGETAVVVARACHDGLCGPLASKSVLIK